MAQPVEYLLNCAHHVLYAAAYMPGAFKVLGGIWDQMLMVELCQEVWEACYNSYLIVIPRPCCSSGVRSSLFLAKRHCIS